MTLKYIWRSFSLGCHFHVHFSYPWHAFASHGLPAIAELLVQTYFWGQNVFPPYSWLSSYTYGIMRWVLQSLWSEGQSSRSRLGLRVETALYGRRNKLLNVLRVKLVSVTVTLNIRYGTIVYFDSHYWNVKIHFHENVPTWVYIYWWLVDIVQLRAAC